jgi:hypothetical protein
LHRVGPITEAQRLPLHGNFERSVTANANVLKAVAQQFAPAEPGTEAKYERIRPTDCTMIPSPDSVG